MPYERNVSTINAGRERLGLRIGGVRKGRYVSTFHQRNRLRKTALENPQRNTGSVRVRFGTWWTNSGAAGVRPVLMSLALVLLTTIGLFGIGDLVRPSAIPLIYMLPVVLAATQWGRVAGLVAAFTSAAAADFFFYPPFYSFWFDSPQDIVDLLLYLLVSVITSNLAARLKNEAATSSRRAGEIADLHAFSQGLATCLTSRDLLVAVQDHLSITLGFRTVLLAATPDEHGFAEDAGVPEQIRREAAKIMAASARQGTIILELLVHRAWLIKIIVPEILGYGAIAIELGGGSGALIEATGKHVEAMIEEATVTLKHLKTKEAIEQATIHYQTEILRDALIGGISHELRSPLTSILGSCSVLNKMPAVQRDRDSHALVEAIHDQAAQLDNNIRDLLDASRISANGVQPQLMWTDPTDIVATAVKQKERRLADHRVVLDLARDAPFVHVDTVLVEQALGQLLENAAKYSPAGTEIKVCSRCGVGYLEISVTDHGSGLTAEEKSALGKRCYRGERHAAAVGSGLGLWIASTFIAANRGTLFAESQGPGCGTTMTVRLPTVCEDTPKFGEASND
jgi:K+-sensing histidine kinase KdpD